MPSFVFTGRAAGSSVRKCTCEPGGLAMHAAIADKKDELAEFCRRYGVSRLEVFGSAAAVRISIRRSATSTSLWNSSPPVNARHSTGTSISPTLCAAPSTDPSIWSSPAPSTTRTCARPSTARASWSMRPDPRVLSADVDRAGADVVRFTGGMDGDAYAGDALTQAAVERKFEIIGEALNRLHQSHPELAERIPRFRRFIGLSQPADPRLRKREARTRLGLCRESPAATVSARARTPCRVGTDERMTT